MLIKCCKHRQVYTNWSVCSLDKHFTRLIVSFQIGSNLISKGKRRSELLCLLRSFGIMIVKKSAINLMACCSEALLIFTRIRLAKKMEAVILLRYKEGRLVSSIESQACKIFVHLNYNRAGQRPMGNTNLYTWAFGLTGLRIPLSLKRICDPTFNMIRGLFVCFWLSLATITIQT